LLAQVIPALILCSLARQPVWWLVIHALFAPLLVAASLLALPSWVYLIALALAWLVFGRIDRSRVPLYLSNAAALRALDELVPENANVLDIGAGTGTVLVWLGRRGNRRMTGVEHAWAPWLVGYVRCLLARNQFELVRADMMDWPLSDYDVVYAFLSPAAMPALWEKAKREMRAGSMLISNTFSIPDAEADRVIEINDWKGARLYLWQM
jgi:SAM-dependent methyltransferase